MKFIADAMLGRLAKQLRLLGFDVHYDPALTDNELLRIALSENRIILTRDRGFASRPLAGNSLLIDADRVDDQISQFRAAFSREMPGHIPLTRCSVCNHALIPLARQDARDRVPRHVYDRQEEFLTCPECGRIYWRGSHVSRMARPQRGAQTKSRSEG